MPRVRAQVTAVSNNRPPDAVALLGETYKERGDAGQCVYFYAGRLGSTAGEFLV